MDGAEHGATLTGSGADPLLAGASGSRQLQRLLEVAQTVAAALDVQHVRAVQQPVQDRRRQHLVAGEQLGPVAHALVGGDHDRAATVAVRHQPKEQARLWRVIGSKPSSSISSSAVDMYLRRFSRLGGRAASALSAVNSSSTRKYCTEKPCSTARIPSPTSRCVLPTPGGPCTSTVSALRTQAQVASVSMRDRSIAGWKAKSKFSSVLSDRQVAQPERCLG